MPLVLALLLALPLVLGAQDADAFRGWCRADPVFRINGETAHVRVAAQVENRREARALGTGEPIRIVLTVPVGVRARHLASDNGFGNGYDVAIVSSSELETTDEAVPVEVAAYVPMTDSTVAIRVSFAPAGRTDRGPDDADDRPGRQPTLGSGVAYGTTNSWISFTAQP